MKPKIGLFKCKRCGYPASEHPVRTVQGRYGELYSEYMIDGKCPNLRVQKQMEDYVEA